MASRSTAGKTSPAPPRPVADGGLADLRDRVRGTNINEKTLLATDYLNHFNEFVMLLEIIPGMPECLEDALAWRPKSYREHFRDSSLSGRDLAIEAYDAAPAEFREPFDSTVATLDALIPCVVARISGAVEAGDADRVAHECASTSKLLQGLMDSVSAIVNGEKTTIDQAGVDALLNG